MVLLIVCILAIVQVEPATVPATQPESIPLRAEIAKALSDNAEQLGTTFTLVWRQQNSSRFSVKDYATLTGQLEVHADWQINGKFENRTTWQDDRFIETRIDLPWPTLRKYRVQLTYSSNGEELYSRELDTPLDEAEPPTEHAVAYLLANLPESMKGEFGWGHAHELQLAGYRVPGTISDMREKAPMRSEIRAMLDEGGKITHIDDVKLDGLSLVRLRIVTEDPERKRALKTDMDAFAEMLRRVSVETEERIQERVNYRKKLIEGPEHIVHTFWLDPKLHYALRRYEQHRADALHERRICDDFAKLPDRDVYLPRKVIFENFHPGRDPYVVEAEPVVVHTYELKEMNRARVGDDTFIPKITTGDAGFTDYRDDPEHPIENSINEDGIPPRKP